MPIPAHAHDEQAVERIGVMRRQPVNRGSMRCRDGEHLIICCPAKFQRLAAGYRHVVRAAPRERMFDRDFPDACRAYEDCVVDIGDQRAGSRIGCDWCALNISKAYRSMAEQDRGHGCNGPHVYLYRFQRQILALASKGNPFHDQYAPREAGIHAYRAETGRCCARAREAGA